MKLKNKKDILDNKKLKKIKIECGKYKGVCI